MYIELLIKTFQNITLDKYPEINTDEFINDLKSRIEKSKFDLQDQTIIERILKEDLESFSESFLELLQTTIPEVEGRIDFFKNEESKKDIIDLYIKSVEHSIDYFYNDIISKQFSGK